MIWFYRDFLDGFVYIIVAILSLIFVMAIIGFIMERMQLKKEQENRMAVLSNDMTSPAPAPVSNPAPAASSNPIDTTKSVVPDSVIQKSQNAATNDNVPGVLDFNQIEEKMNQQ